MGHGSACGYTVQLIGQGAGSAGTSADIRGTGTVNSGILTMGTAGTEFGNGTSLCGAYHAGCLGGDQGLVVQSQKNVGLEKLCFDGGSTYGHNGFAGEDNGSFRYSPDIAGEFEITEEGEKFFIENLLSAEIFDVGIGEVQILDVADDLFQTCRNGVTASIGYATEEYVKIGDPVPQLGFKITAAHGQLIEVTQQGKAVFVVFHKKTSIPLYRMMLLLLLTVPDGEPRCFGEPTLLQPVR